MAQNRNRGGCGSPFSTQEWSAKGRKWKESSMQNFKFTNKQEIDNYFNHSKLLCLECGEQRANLTLHLRSHRMNKDEYCRKHNLPTNRGLVGADTRDKIVEINKDRMAREMDNKSQSMKVKQRLINNNIEIIKDRQCKGCLKYFRGNQWQPKCPECIKERKRKYVLNNRDKIREIAKRHYYKKKFLTNPNNKEK